MKCTTSKPHTATTKQILRTNTKHRVQSNTYSKLSKSVVLLDFDGVVCRNAYADAFVMKRILDYVEHVTGLTNSNDVATFNTHLYSVYGHTLRGLKEYGHHVTLNDFNNYVYKDLHLHSNLKLTISEILDLTAFMIRCKHNNIDIMFYSNAPSKWMLNFIYWDATLFAVQDTIITKHGNLKPEWKTYNETHHFLQNHGYDSIYFVDDSFTNLTSTPNQWTPIWFTESKTEAFPMFNVKSLKHASQLICDLDK